ncbi:response regulator [Massilia arenosa]|uniref:Response regulator n=1 Tax=Zemynaea arenosa TaxID=2561931 RepID=A0A4Y9SGG4_9BURK|nr:response regulator [Massilia arenosa]TFW20233.1 response regulator [Massilia arenosa]
MGKLQTILYVEDDLHVRTTAKLVLEVIGKYDVCECASGEEALQLAREIAPDLVLLDVMMPELDGIQLLHALRRLPHMADVPALFVTARTSAYDIERYMEAGAIGIIPKPLVPLRLTDQLRTAWEQRPRMALPQTPGELAA